MYMLPEAPYLPESQSPSCNNTLHAMSASVFTDADGQHFMQRSVSCADHLYQHLTFQLPLTVVIQMSVSGYSPAFRVQWLFAWG